MPIKKNILSFLLVTLLFSCVTTKKNYNPQKKYPQQQLQEDYSLLRNILEKKHPSLYWYTSKDSMDMYFDKYYRAIEDSMTEQQFGWKIIAPLVNKIRCGHTSFSMSKAYNRWTENKKFVSFPMLIRFWNDTMAVSLNLNRNDSILKRGALITSINGFRNKQLVDSMFGYMTADGFANNVNYNRLSNNFPFYHRNIFGTSKQYTLQYLDHDGKEQTINVPLIQIPKDSLQKLQKRKFLPIEKRTWREKRKDRLLADRSMAVDSTNNTAIITLNTFSSGHLRKFFRQSFRYIRKTNISSVVLDIRSNGGGKINLSKLLTKYVSRVPFKVADTVFAVTKNLRPYTKYISGKFFNNIALFFLTKKQADGFYHFGMWERKYYSPKKLNHFGGDLYVLTNGLTFSASTLFCNAVKGQPGIKLIGEETGGGWHGNDGIIIPDITLPHTHLKIRLPLFRMVQYKHVQKDGRGVMPDIYIGTNYEALVKGFDKKMQVVIEIIKGKNAIRNK